MREAEFLERLGQLLDQPVVGLSRADKAHLVEAALDALVTHGDAPPPRVVMVPFVRGRRPMDEAHHPGHGSSEHVALVLGDAADDELFLLYHLTGLDELGPEALAQLALDVSLAFVDAEGVATPIPGWTARAVTPTRFVPRPGGAWALEPLALSAVAAEPRALTLRFPVREVFLPGAAWRWEELPEAFRARASEPDPFSLGHAFHQRVEIALRLSRAGVPLSVTRAEVEVADARRMGSLYQRVLERVVGPDTARQARAAGVPSPGEAYHPWYPVLRIGGDKAALYMNALEDDIAGAGRYFANPRWLLDVGLYLELLTGLGILAAVEPELGDLLTPEERRALASNPVFDRVRDHIDVDAWRKVWAARHIAFPTASVPSLGPVAGTNLLRKRAATLAFLETHHKDLERAIALAGPNRFNAQETWHRVFRDAERAVLRQTADAFPELGAMPARMRDFVLWHRSGDKAPLGLGWAWRPMIALVGDQDGLYATACSQYRASMNHVADWARRRGLMDHTGAECVPLSASLVDAHLRGATQRLEALQRHDGFVGGLEGVLLPGEAPEAAPEVDTSRLLERVPVFQALTAAERAQLAGALRPMRLAPLARALVQGEDGSSLFVVTGGQVEVLQRLDSGDDVPVATLGPGAAFGELSLLTGAPRSATVRATDQGAALVEIAKHHIQPLISARPALLDALVTQMERRLEQTGRRVAAFRASAHPSRGIRQRVMAFLVG